jgi:nitrate/nitrite-specific signal transduction histidine kinase
MSGKVLRGGCSRYAGNFEPSTVQNAAAFAVSNAASIKSLMVLLFQAVRELLVNVVKHSSASAASVSVTKTDDKIKSANQR